MAIRKDPNAIQVNGALVFIKDPSAAKGSLFDKWRRLSGLGSFTLPAEAGSVTDTPGIDGSISFANVAGVGNISGTIIALNAGIVHRFMESRAKSGEAIQMSLVRPAVRVDSYEGIAAAVAIVAVNTGTGVNLVVNQGRIVVPQAFRKRVAADVREGMIVGIALDEESTTAGDVPNNVTDVLDYDDESIAGNDRKWRTILEVSTKGDWIDVAPNFSGVQAVTASKTGSIQIRNPGRTFQNLHGTVNQFDRGDAQAGGGISSNLQFVPSSALDVAAVEQRLVGEGTVASAADGGILDGYTQAGGFDIDN